MARSYGLPGADEARLTAALARLEAHTARLDTVERTLDALGKDVTACGVGLGKVLGQLRDTAPEDVEDGTGAAEDADPGQPDWWTVTDPDVATGWLNDAAEWLHDVGAIDGLAPTVCWPLHPMVVVEVLALRGVHEAAYADRTPTAVAEYLDRWLPRATGRITKALKPCAAGHQHGQATYYVSGLDLGKVGQWWATDRATPAPTALRLRTIDAR